MSNNINPAKAAYQRGWGPNEEAATPIIASCDLVTQDMVGQPVLLSSDVTPDYSPIIFGMDVNHYAITNNIARP